MNNALLVDFGATHIKSVIFSIENNEYINFDKLSSPQSISKNKNEFVICTNRLLKTFENICVKNLKYNYDAIFISSQMHGFAIADKNNKLLSDYISWQDQRGKLLDIENFDKITGMKNRIGLPVNNLAQIVNVENFVDPIKVITLPELLSNIHEKSENIVHNTMIASTGLYDINNEAISENILNHIQQAVVFNKSSSSIQVSGFYNDIPIYCGIGDLQAAINGNDSATNKSILVNIGTGSQVSLISKSKKQPPNLEYRPYIDGNHLHTITHIPAGRALNTLLFPFREMGIDCWSRINDYSVEQIHNSTLDIDFSVFESANNYVDGGFIKNITEQNFNIDNIFCSLIKQLCLQYAGYIDKFNYKSDLSCVILSGGISKNIPTLQSLIETYTGKKCLTNYSNIDETLHGLAKIATTCA